MNLSPMALAALESYQQADEDGVMVLVSRQALDEAIAALRAAPVPPCDAETRDVLWGISERVSNVIRSYMKKQTDGRLMGLLNDVAHDVHEEIMTPLVSPPSEATRFINGVREIQEYLEAKEPRIGDATFICEALLAGAATFSPPSEAGREMLAPNHVAVPKAALAWLFGEAPDADGKWFGECEDAELGPIGKFPRRFWWRSKFRKLAALSPDQGTVAVAAAQSGGGK